MGINWLPIGLSMWCAFDFGFNFGLTWELTQAVIWILDLDLSFDSEKLFDFEMKLNSLGLIWTFEM